MATARVRERISTVFRKSVEELRRVEPDCVATVNCTLNNTHVCFSRPSGEVIAKASAGMSGFKGPKRGSAEGAAAAAARAAALARERGCEVTRLRIKGAVGVRGVAIAGIVQAGLKVSHLEDITPFPANGCRPRKSRRL